MTKDTNEMSRYKWILDAGHGGMKAGVYTTAPGKMFAFPDSSMGAGDAFTFHEGVNNRAIASELMPMLDQVGIEYALTYDDDIDTTLGKRVRIANALYEKDKRCILLSIHSDAMPDGHHGKAQGFSIWTSIGETKSDKVANIFLQAYEKEFPDFRIHGDKSDGDKDKEENFYILKKTSCPAVLTENLFYDNRKEALFLLSPEGRTRIARAMFEAIKLCETLKPI